VQVGARPRLESVPSIRTLYAVDAPVPRLRHRSSNPRKEHTVRVISLIAVLATACAVLPSCRNHVPVDAPERAVESTSAGEREQFEFMVQSRINEIDERIPGIREALVAMDQETKSTVFLEINEILQLRAALDAHLQEFSRLPEGEGHELEAEMRELLSDIDRRFQEIHALLGPSAFSPASLDADIP
jgi:hypothetical protein